MYGINRAGANGEIMALIGSRNSESGGNSLAPMSMSGATDGRSTIMSVYPGNSSLLLEQLHEGGSGGGASAGTGGPGGGGGGGGGGHAPSNVEAAGEQYLSAAAREVVSSDSIPGGDVNFLQAAVSSLLNSAESAARAVEGNRGHDTGGGDLSPRPHPSRRKDSNSGGISSPTEVLVAPLQVATEELSTSIQDVEEIASFSAHESDSAVASDEGGVVSNMVVVEVDPQDATPSLVGGEELGVVITDTPIPASQVEQEVLAEDHQSVEKLVEQDIREK